MTKEQTNYIIKEFYTLEQLSNEINITIPSLRKFIKEGKLKASKVGTIYCVTRENINDWLKDNEVKRA